MSEKLHLSIPEIAHELTEQHLSLQIIGSLARAAHMNIVFNEVRPTGDRRDIDVFRTGERTVQLPDTKSGVKVDSVFEEWIRPEANGTWLVYPYDERLAVEVPYPEDVFAPQEVEMADSVLRVPHPQTLGAISTMQYIQRPKDRKAMALYNEWLDSREGGDELPASLFQPFEEFRGELAKQKGYVRMSHVRNMYHIMIPSVIRNNDRVRPVAKHVRSALSKIL